MTHDLRWWLTSDAAMGIRVTIGVAIFAILAVTDYRRRRSAATRWREYLFLCGAVAVALFYGVINDRITSSISWEYFYYGKGLDERLGPQTPPARAALHREACKIAAKASWSAGLIVGVLLLLANNPRNARPQLSYRR